MCSTTGLVVGNLSLRRNPGPALECPREPDWLDRASDGRLVSAQDYRRNSGAARWSGNSDSFSLYSDILAAPKPVRPWRSNRFDVPPPGHNRSRCQLAHWISDRHRRPSPPGQSIQLLLICRVRMTARALVRPAALACAVWHILCRRVLAYTCRRANPRLLTFLHQSSKHQSSKSGSGSFSLYSDIMAGPKLVSSRAHRPTGVQSIRRGLAARPMGSSQAVVGCSQSQL